MFNSINTKLSTAYIQLSQSIVKMMSLLLILNQTALHSSRGTNLMLSIIILFVFVSCITVTLSRFEFQLNPQALVQLLWWFYYATMRQILLQFSSIKNSPV